MLVVVCTVATGDWSIEEPAGEGGPAPAVIEPTPARVAPTPTPPATPTPTLTPAGPALAVMGVWVDRIALASVTARIAIVEDAGRLYADTEYSDGSTRRTPLVEAASPMGRRFNVVGDALGEHYVIVPSGDLQLRDKDGPIRTARRAAGE